MNHGYFQDRLSAYFDQALTLEEMRAVEEHLADCAECRKRLDDLAKLDQLIEDKADLGESDYWEKAAQKIEQRIGSVDDEKITDARSGWFGLGWKLVAAAASVAALTFVALHEGEIQDTVLRQDKSPETVMAPGAKDGAPLTTDSGSGQVFDLEDFKAELRSAQDSHAEPAERKTSPEPGGKDKGPAKSASDNATEKFELDESPLETVDELLESVAGVVTNSSGEIFVRGGRAGEADYIVDGVPAEDTDDVTVDMGKIALTKKTTDIGKTITVRAEVDIIEKFETTHQMSVSKEQPDDSDRVMRQPVTSVEELMELPGMVTREDTRAEGPVPNLSLVNPTDNLGPEQTLAWWRAERDLLHWYVLQSSETYSFSDTKSKRAEKDRVISLNSPISSPPPVVDSVKPPTRSPLERYLEACYKIAELTDRESEYDSAVVIIENYAKDKNSPVQDLAQDYLDKIDELQE